MVTERGSDQCRALLALFIRDWVSDRNMGRPEMAKILRENADALDRAEILANEAISKLRAKP